MEIAVADAGAGVSAEDLQIVRAVVTTKRSRQRTSAFR